MNTKEQSPLTAPEVEPVIVHLSGRLRGTTRYLDGEPFLLGTAPEAEIHFPSDHDDEVAPRHAQLQAVVGGWELVVEPGQQVWVNGRAVERVVLRSEDLLEIGSGGPVLRFREHAVGTPEYKTMAEALADCVDCARIDGEGPLERTRIFLREVPRELAEEVSPWWRLGVLALLIALAVNSVFLVRQSQDLEERLDQEAQRVEGISALLEVSRSEALRPQDLAQLRVQLENEVLATADRLEDLEDQLEADRRVISAASRSVAFLQGAYGFVEVRSGLFLRLLVDENGNPRYDATGVPAVGTEGEGPVIESLFTGTAFLVEGGLWVTNRHVAVPWEYEASAQAVAAQGYEARMRRFIAYLPDRSEPLGVELVAVSEQADLAILRGAEAVDRLALPLAEVAPELGDAVLVMGYPTGIQALLARTDAAFLAELESAGDLGFWQVAQRLAARSQIAPLATRGIVGQVTEAAVVYDAETTSGGSGGPVLDLSGRVVAINTAILAEFGGSNLGTPTAFALELLERELSDARTTDR